MDHRQEIRPKWQDFARARKSLAALTADGVGAQLVNRASSAARTALTEQVRLAYCAELADGPRSFAAMAWAFRGTVPN
jgi:predicted ATPase